MKFLEKIKDFIYWEILNRLKGNNQDVVCAVIINDNKILAQTAQKNKLINTDDTQYVVPGGKVEAGETINAAVHREIKEETNLNIDVIKKLGTTRNNKYKLHWFICSPTDLSLLKVVEPFKQNFEALMKYKNQISNIQKEIIS